MSGCWFDIGYVEIVADVTRRQIVWWGENGLIHPTRRRGARAVRLYDVHALIMFYFVGCCKAAGMPLTRLHKTLPRLRAHLPQLAGPTYLGLVIMCRQLTGELMLAYSAPVATRGALDGWVVVRLNELFFRVAQSSAGDKVSLAHLSLPGHAFPGGGDQYLDEVFELAPGQAPGEVIG